MLNVTNTEYKYKSNTDLQWNAMENMIIHLNTMSWFRKLLRNNENYIIQKV